MKECWQEGDLRAYCDRELAPEVMELASAHLAECPECRGRLDELAARAQRVSAWMEALPEPVARTAVRQCARKNWRWVAIAAAAAILLAAIALAPYPARRRELPAAPRVAKSALPPVVHAPDAPSAEPPALPVREAAIQPRPQRRRVASRAAGQTETFVALDDEPFEAGWVVRMALGPDQVQADVVFSADGRARAYRLVSDSSN